MFYRRRLLQHVNKFRKSIRYFSTTPSSKYSRDPTNTEIIQYLRSQGLNANERFSGGIATETCPLCPKPHNNERSNLWTLNFKENSGAFMCFRCGSSGSWSQFKRSVSGGSQNVYKDTNSLYQLRDSSLHHQCSDHHTTHHSNRQEHSRNLRPDTFFEGNPSNKRVRNPVPEPSKSNRNEPPGTRRVPRRQGRELLQDSRDPGQGVGTLLLYFSPRKTEVRGFPEGPQLLALRPKDQAGDPVRVQDRLRRGSLPGRQPLGRACGLSLLPDVRAEGRRLVSQEKRECPSG